MCFFFFNDTATTEIYTLSLHDALPILTVGQSFEASSGTTTWMPFPPDSSGKLLRPRSSSKAFSRTAARSEEHTSELQSRQYLVCRLLLEKKKKQRQRLQPRQQAICSPD